MIRTSLPGKRVAFMPHQLRTKEHKDIKISPTSTTWGTQCQQRAWARDRCLGESTYMRKRLRHRLSACGGVSRSSHVDVYVVSGRPKRTERVGAFSRGATDALPSLATD
ncbi:unnamed protein product, partial [Ectocarpus sp. 12 AP-2014]